MHAQTFLATLYLSFHPNTIALWNNLPYSSSVSYKQSILRVAIIIVL